MVAAADGIWSYWNAPAAYLGDRSAYVGGSLSFDLRSNLPLGHSFNCTPSIIGDVELLGAGQRLEYDIPGPTMAADMWHSLQVPLSAPGWKHLDTQQQVSDADFAAVLGSLTDVRIRAEWSAALDTDDLDNVVLAPAPNADPSCAAVVAGPNVLWPPNHKLRTIALTGATDPDGDPVTLTVTGVTQDEPVDVDGAPDARHTGVAGTVDVRAERSGSGDGRVYRIAFIGSDGEGGSCTGTATIGVPHDQGKGSVAVDSGGAYDSFGV